MKGHANVDYSRLFSLSGGILHGHSMKLFKRRCRANLHKIYSLTGCWIFGMILIQMVLIALIWIT